MHILRGLLGPYRRLLRHPGAWQFSAAALLARLPLSMTGLGIVLLVSAIQGGYLLAGVLTAAYAFAAAIVSPIGARYVDRWGQFRVVRVLLLVHVASLVSFIVGVLLGLPVAALIAFAIGAGAAQPASGSLVRARWAHAVGGTPSLRVAFAWESVLDEVIFVIGPPLAALLALFIAPAAPLIAAALLVSGGGIWLISHRRSEPPAHHIRQRGPSLVRNPLIVSVTLMMVFLGGLFGSLEIVTVAAAAEVGSPAYAGLILSVYAAGSLVSGVVFGGRTESTRSPQRQLLLWAIALAAVTAPFPLVSGIAAWTLVAFLAGLAVAPVLILANSIVQQGIPAQRLTEGLAWINTTGLGLGVALSAAASGALVDAFGSRAGYCLTAGSAIATMLIALLTYRRLHAHLQRDSSTDSAVDDAPHNAEVPPRSHERTGETSG
ncbi:MAG: MFS transporter [Candidatus Nanopelagicales bacterium]